MPRAAVQVDGAAPAADGEARADRRAVQTHPLRRGVDGRRCRARRGTCASRCARQHQSGVARRTSLVVLRGAGREPRSSRWRDTSVDPWVLCRLATRADATSTAAPLGARRCRSREGPARLPLSRRLGLLGGRSFHDPPTELPECPRGESEGFGGVATFLRLPRRRRAGQQRRLVHDQQRDSAAHGVIPLGRLR